MGFGHVLVLTDDGEVFGFGMNRHGQAGSEFTPARAKITVIASGMVDIAAGSTHSLLLGADGTVHSFGSAGDGKLGRMEAEDTFVPLPVEFEQNVSISKVFAGCDHSIVVGSKGEAFAWGFGQHGAVGTGRLETESVPRRVDLKDAVENVYCGTDFSLFQLKN